MTCEKLLRLLIREEIGRDHKTDDKVDFYPWHTPEDNISIFSNLDTEPTTFTASVEIDGEETKIKDFTDNEEAKHWSRKQVDNSKRKKFASIK